MSLPVAFFQVRQIHRPRQSRAAPDLALWTKLMTLLDGAHPKRIRRGVLDCSSIDWCSAVAAEGMSASCAAVRGFDVNLRLTSEQQKRLDRCRDIGPIDRAGQCLTVSTVADANGARVDFCLICDVATMTAAFDLHGSPLTAKTAVGLSACWALSSPKMQSFRVSSKSRTSLVMGRELNYGGLQASMISSPRDTVALPFILLRRLASPATTGVKS